MPHQAQVCTGASSSPHVLCTLKGKPSPSRGLAPEDPISKCVSPGFTLRGYLAALVLAQILPQAGPASGSAVPMQMRGWPQGLCASILVCSYELGRSDLGPPAFDELHDLLDLQLGEMEVICQDVLTELHKDAAIDAFSGKEAHHIL